MSNDQSAMMKMYGVAVIAIVVAGCARHLPPPERAIKTNVVALRKALGGGAEATSAATNAPMAEPTGWAMIKGSFKLNGTPPARAPLAVTKDHEVCAPGGKPVLSEDLVVDSSGGIKDVVIYLAGPGKFPVGDAKWEHPDYAKAATASEDYDQKNCIFLTHMSALRSKQKLRILNSDPVGHNTNIQGGGKTTPFNATIPAGASATYDPVGESAEPFGVSCSIHPWMSARMIVRDSPYFAVTKADGTFEIANVPAGVPLEFRVWQEKSKFIQDVTRDGKQEKWKSGRFKVTLTPNEPMTMNVVVDVAAFGK